MDTVQSQQAATQRVYAQGLIPSFIGLDKSSAQRLAENRNIKLSTNGFGVVIKQSIEPGTPQTEELVVRLQFEAPTYAD
jgi:cell division protein FtsI (penicillin-binding protein 3)